MKYSSIKVLAFESDRPEFESCLCQLLFILFNFSYAKSIAHCLYFIFELDIQSFAISFIYACIDSFSYSGKKVKVVHLFNLLKEYSCAYLRDGCKDLKYKD